MIRTAHILLTTVQIRAGGFINRSIMGAKLRAVLTTITNIIAAFAMIKIALIMLETVQTE